MAVAAVAALQCAGSLSSGDSNSSMNAQLSSILYAVAIAAAADGDNKRSRDLLTACGRLGGACQLTLLASALLSLGSRISQVSWDGDAAVLS
jgi:hypothetical protein